MADFGNENSLSLIILMFIIIPFILTVVTLSFVYQTVLKIKSTAKLSLQTLRVESKLPFISKLVEIHLDELGELVLLRDHAFSTTVKILDVLTSTGNCSL